MFSMCVFTCLTAGAQEAPVVKKVEQLLEQAGADYDKKPQESIDIALKALEISKKSKIDSLIIKSHFALAEIYYWGVADYSRVRTHLDTVRTFFKKLTVKQKCNYFSMYADAIYYDGKYVTAIELYYKALEYVGANLRLKARIFHNLGWVYADLGRYKKAIEYGHKGLELSTKLDSSNVIHKLNGMVYIYSAAGKSQEALKCLKRIQKLSTNAYDLCFLHYRKATFFSGEGNYDSAIHCFKQAYYQSLHHGYERTQIMALYGVLDIFLDLNRPVEFASWLSIYENLLKKYDLPEEQGEIYARAGIMYFKLNKVDSAAIFLQKAEKFIGKSEQRFDAITYRGLSLINMFQNNHEKASEYLEKFFESTDSLLSTQQIAVNRSIDDFDKIYELDNVVVKKENELQKQALRIESDKYIKIIYLAVLGIVLILVWFIWRSLRVRDKHNRELKSKNELIENQKQLVEAKNKETTDSILYAKRIQDSLLPNEKYIQKALERLNKP